jgi:hypothetical protein
VWIINKNTCRYCEFCFPEDNECYICADANYGKDISETLDVVKTCYSEGLEAFIERSNQEAVIVNTPLSQIKIDGRKRLDLVELEGKTLSVKTSKAKQLLGDVVVLKVMFEDTYDVKDVFSNELFKGGRYLVIK